MDMNKVKNHPGFMPFGHKNVNGVSAGTQVALDREKEREQKVSDNSVK